MTHSVPLWNSIERSRIKPDSSITVAINLNSTNQANYELQRPVKWRNRRVLDCSFVNGTFSLCATQRVLSTGIIMKHGLGTRQWACVALSVLRCCCCCCCSCFDVLCRIADAFENRSNRICSRGLRRPNVCCLLVARLMMVAMFFIETCS